MTILDRKPHTRVALGFLLSEVEHFPSAGELHNYMPARLSLLGVWPFVLVLTQVILQVKETASARHFILQMFLLVVELKGLGLCGFLRRAL